jgi:hypothetical protein
MTLPILILRPRASFISANLRHKSRPQSHAGKRQKKVVGSINLNQDGYTGGLSRHRLKRERPDLAKKVSAGEIISTPTNPERSAICPT